LGASIQSSTTRPEHALLLAATGVTDSARDAVSRALSFPLDWTCVIELALRHRMTPALLAALEVANPSLVPIDLLSALRDHCRTLRARGEALTNELFELLDALGTHSVRAIPFKGPLLGELLFGDASLRSPGDLDILFRPGDVSRVCDVLESRGYVDANRRPDMPRMTPTQQRMYQRFQCEYQFIRGSDGAVVEPHWGLSQHPMAIDVDYGPMLDRVRPVDLRGRSVLALRPDDLLLALCIHGAKHHWERLAWIRDVAALLARYPELDLEACVMRARRQGCARILLLGLGVAQKCAQAQLPAVVGRAIDADQTTSALRGEVVAHLFGPARDTPWNDRVDRFRLRMRERWADRVRYVSRTWLTPRRHHIEMVALPGPLRWGYVPLKLGLDFAVLPLWGLLKSAGRQG
jgi:hypothetical protein